MPTDANPGRVRRGGNELTPQSGSQRGSAGVVESGDPRTHVGVLRGFEVGALPAAAAPSHAFEHCVLLYGERGKVGGSRDYAKSRPPPAAVGWIRARPAAPRRNAEAELKAGFPTIFLVCPHRAPTVLSHDHERPLQLLSLLCHAGAERKRVVI